MAWWNPDNSDSDKSELLNHPVGTGWGLRRERNVGNNFGVYYVTEPSNPGDFDGDGGVDGSDFLLQQRDPSVGLLSD